MSDHAYGIGADEPMKIPSLENIDRFARQFELTDVQKQTIINIFYRNDQSDETLRSANVAGIILQRKGRWVNQEAVYADFLCQEFDAGISDIAEGTTKRAYLSDSLVCTKMRISKKFKGTKIGKEQFLKKTSPPMCTPEQRHAFRQRHIELRRQFILATFISMIRVCVSRRKGTPPAPQAGTVPPTSKSNKSKPSNPTAAGQLFCSSEQMATLLQTNALGRNLPRETSLTSSVSSNPPATTLGSNRVASLMTPAHVEHQNGIAGLLTGRIVGMKAPSPIPMNQQLTATIRQQDANLNFNAGAYSVEAQRLPIWANTSRLPQNNTSHPILMPTMSGTQAIQQTGNKFVLNHANHSSLTSQQDCGDSFLPAGMHSSAPHAGYVSSTMGAFTFVLPVGSMIQKHRSQSTCQPPRRGDQLNISTNNMPIERPTDATKEASRLERASVSIPNNVTGDGNLRKRSASEFVDATFGFPPLLGGPEAKKFKFEPIKTGDMVTAASDPSSSSNIDSEPSSNDEHDSSEETKSSKSSNEAARSNKAQHDLEVTDFVSGFDEHTAAVKVGTGNSPRKIGPIPVHSHFFAGLAGESPFISSKSFDELHSILDKTPLHLDGHNKGNAVQTYAGAGDIAESAKSYHSMAQSAAVSIAYQQHPNQPYPVADLQQSRNGPASGYMHSSSGASDTDITNSD